MKLLFFFTITLLTIACSYTSSKNGLLNNISFSLEEGEVFTPKDTTVIKHFASLFIYEKDIIPLYKYIETNSHRIYIGLPYQFNYKKITNKDILKSDSITLKESNNKDFLYRQFSLENTFYSEYIIEVNESLLFILVETDDKKIRDDGFNLKSISSRIETL